MRNNFIGEQVEDRTDTIIRKANVATEEIMNRFMRYAVHTILFLMFLCSIALIMMYRWMT